MNSTKRILAVSFAVVALAGCSEFYSLAPRPLIKTVGNFSIISTGVLMGTDKTLSDHWVSYNTGKDCSTVRVEQGRTYCREDEPNPIPVVHCYQTLGDVTCYSQPDPSRQLDDRIGNLQN
ncbi:MAG: hypothetical protein HUJ11_05830 [Arenibacter algicola]|nr:hypothetical protein [Arenibacter algicola]